MIKNFESSIPSQKAREIINNYQKHKIQNIKLSEHKILRDYLLISITLTNCCRPGVLANMLVDEFRSAELVNNNNELYYVIYVKQHKTVRKHGPAGVVLKNIYMREYIQQ